MAYSVVVSAVMVLAFWSETGCGEFAALVAVRKGEDNESVRESGDCCGDHRSVIRNVGYGLPGGERDFFVVVVGGFHNVVSLGLPGSNRLGWVS